MKKIVLYTTPIILLLLLIVYWLFYSSIASLTSVDLPEKSDGKLLFNIESLGSNQVNDVNAIVSIQHSTVNFRNAISISGWIANSDATNEDKTTYIVFDGEKNTFVFKIRVDNLTRPDVSEGIANKKIGDNHGFIVHIPKSKMKDDYYRIGFYREDATGNHLSYTNQAIELSGNNILFGLYSPYSKQVDISVPSANRNTKGNIETISIIEQSNALVVNGWGIIDSMDAKNSKIWITLSKGETTLLFEPFYVSRPDVTSTQTQYLNLSGFDLNNSGFSSKIRLFGLPDGNYIVGIMIQNAQLTGFLSSNKTVNISDGIAKL